MIEIKPNIQHQSNCPYCNMPLNPIKVRWQGMHVCVETKCINCKAELLDSLKIGHAVDKPFQVDLVKEEIFGHPYVKRGLAQDLIKSLQNPESEQLEISKEVFKSCQRVIILNCIDYIYGHCLLKLLNAQRHIDCHLNYGLIVIVPKFLRWMVPEGVAEIWTVPISLKKGQCYYPSFAEFVSEELKRFDEVYVSEAYSHPSRFDITRFTRVPKHCFEQEELKITFIWREDRMWFEDEFGFNNLVARFLRKIKMIKPIVILQNLRVRRLLAQIRTKVPAAKFAITGLGKQTQFPAWIEDLRVDKFDEQTEKAICKHYSESRLVIGIHGSNMLLPSAHAGMTLDLMPDGRWNNLAQDILCQESDPRIASLRYRYLPLDTNIDRLAYIASTMLLKYSELYRQMIPDKVVSDGS